MTRGIIRDITERKQADAELRLFRSLIDRTNDAIFVVDPDTGRFLYVNEKACGSLGYSREELLQMSVTDIEAVVPDNFSWEAHVREVRTQGAMLLEGQHKCKDGLIFPVEVNVSFIGHEQADYMVAVVRDITERKRGEEQLRRSEEQLKVSLKEKELLLQEVHHRVQNNLQLVSSLLSLQAESSKNQQVRDAFRDSQNRIMAMSLIHERLDAAKGFARVEFAEYINGLTVQLLRSFGRTAKAAAVIVNVDVAPLDIDQAIPCGLIINELVSNALKHAFPANRVGKIQVDVHGGQHGNVVLRVSDNGIGSPAGVVVTRADTLGLQLVHNLTEQLGGTIEMDGHDGTIVTITFPLQPGWEQGD